MAQATSGSASSSTAYGSPGPYRNGIWLVYNSGSQQEGLVDRAHLPSGSGWRYYWLGTTQSEANARILTAGGDLDAPLPTSSIPAAISTAFRTGQFWFDVKTFGLLPPGPGSDVGNSISSTLGALTSSGFWLGLLEIVGGALLVIMGLYWLRNQI